MTKDESNAVLSVLDKMFPGECWAFLVIKEGAELPEIVTVVDRDDLADLLERGLAMSKHGDEVRLNPEKEKH